MTHIKAVSNQVKIRYACGLENISFLKGSLIKFGPFSIGNNFEEANIANLKSDYFKISTLHQCDIVKLMVV